MLSFENLYSSMGLAPYRIKKLDETNINFTC